MLRIFALIVSGLLVQTLVLPEFRVFGAAPDLVLVIVLAIGFREDPETAAVAGFAGGVLLDLFLRTPLGISAITFAVAGYVVAALHTGILRPSRVLIPLIGGLGGLGAGAGYLLIATLAGQEGLLTMQSLQILLVASFLDALIAPLVFPVVGRVLGEDRSLAER